jgi:hypothetical protein
VLGPARPVTRPTPPALGLAILALLILLTVVGATAEHGAGTAQLHRGPASAILSVFITLAGLAGIGSLALLFWGLVRRNRGGSDGGGRGRSPILLVVAGLAIFAVLSALLALAAHDRHFQSLKLTGRPAVPGGSAASPVPFNTLASFTTSGIVVGIVLLAVCVRLGRSFGWRRALRRFGLIAPADDEEENEKDAGPGPAESFGSELGTLAVADPSAEPDPRRAVIACYLRLLEIAARHGPQRRQSETPTEYLRRALSVSQPAAVPARALTALFERARYSRQAMDESMRSEAIAALRALQVELFAGTPA